jgi:hypothetical protein
MKQEQEKKAIPAATATNTPYEYVGPTPPPLVSNLPCKCTLPANQLTRPQQDYLIQTNPQTAAWFIVVS